MHFYFHVFSLTKCLGNKTLADQCFQEAFLLHCWSHLYLLNNRCCDVLHTARMKARLVALGKLMSLQHKAGLSLCKSLF